MSHIPASRLALVTEDRSTRMARREWQGRKASPAAVEMAALHMRKSQLGFALVAVFMASAFAASAVVMAVAFGA